MGDLRDLFAALNTSIRGLPKDWKRLPWLPTLRLATNPGS